MKRYIFLIIGLSFFSCMEEPTTIYNYTPCGSTKLVNSHLKSESLQVLLEETALANLPGVSLVVENSTKGSFYGTAGKADLHNKVEMDVCKRFRVASLTKVFIATAIMMLVEQERLSLDTPIELILSENVLKDIKRANEAKVMNLLNHTSGIANYDDNQHFPAMILNEPGKRISLSEKLDLIRGQDATPAWVVEKFGSIYSNSNYLLLQIILEKITNATYENFIRENILNPLDLESTSFSTENPYPENLALGYIDFYDQGNLRDVSEWDAQRFDGEGSMLATSKDIAVFFKALLKGELLKESTVVQMKEQGLGLLKENLNDQLFIGHDGLAIGYSAEMWYSEESNDLVVLLANQGRISDEQPSIQPFEILLVDIIKLLQE
ncbi:MAG: serine hydrolase domain-containing protein [Bacteroidota bacterium]